MNLLLAGGTVVTSLDPVSVEQADVLIGGGRVVAVGTPTPQPGAEGAVQEVIDASGCLIMPGNVNAHTHLHSALARGMPFNLEPPTMAPLLSMSCPSRVTSLTPPMYSLAVSISFTTSVS